MAGCSAMRSTPALPVDGPPPVTPEQEDGDDEDPFGQYAEDDTCAARADQVTNGDDDLIFGIEDAAGFLGYGKADSFRRARTRHPIPNETRTSGGRPAWTARTLLSWRSQGRRQRPAPENLTQDGGRAP